jgi:hypothetical protein
VCGRSEERGGGRRRRRRGGARRRGKWRCHGGLRCAPSRRRLGEVAQRCWIRRESARLRAAADVQSCAASGRCAGHRSGAIAGAWCAQQSSELDGRTCRRSAAAAARRQCAGEKRDRARWRVRVRGAVPLGVVCLDGVMEEGTGRAAPEGREERGRGRLCGCGGATERAREGARGLSSRQVAPPRAQHRRRARRRCLPRHPSRLVLGGAASDSRRSRAWMSCCGRAHAMPLSAPRRPSCGTPPAGLAPSRPRALAQGQEVICARTLQPARHQRLASGASGGSQEPARAAVGTKRAGLASHADAWSCSQLAAVYRLLLERREATNLPDMNVRQSVVLRKPRLRAKCAF